MNANDKFQLWSPPKLDLSLDSFSDDLLQQFDNKRRQNITVTPTETLIPSPLQQQQKEDYLPQTPISSSLISEQEQHQPDDKEEEEQIQEDDEENGEEGEREIEEDGDSDEDDNNDDDKSREEIAEVEGKGDAEENQGESDEENNKNEQVEENDVVEGTPSSTNVFRKSSSFLKKRISQNIGNPVKEDEEQQQQGQKTREVINSKVAPPDVKAISVPDQPPVTPKRRSFFSFRFC